MPDLTLCRPKGRPRVGKTEDGRLRVARYYDVRADAIEPAVINAKVFDAWLVPDAKYTNCLLVDQYTTGAPDQGVEVVLTQIFEQMTSGVSRVGDIGSRMADARAYVGTDASGKLTGSTRWAREWTVRYVTSTDVTVSDGLWHAVSTSMAFGSRTGYLTGTSVLGKGQGFTLLVRTYNELPSKYTYPRADRYFFPGGLGVSNGMPIGFAGVTRQTTLDVEETYHLGEVDPQAIEFEVLSWASGHVNFTSGGVDGSKAFNFTGSIGSISTAASDVWFNGLLCSSLSGTIESNPSAYPTGKKRIGSVVNAWRGDIWRRDNIYVTFP